MAKDQGHFVAGNPWSIAQAHFSDHAWFRAIYADETPVGFLMLYDDPARSQYFLWRLMVDERFQGYSYGRRGVELLIEHVKSRPGAVELLVSHMPGEGNPGPFYERFVMRLPLTH